MRKQNMFSDRIVYLLVLFLLSSCQNRRLNESNTVCVCDSTCTGRLQPVIEYFPDSVDKFGHIPYTVVVCEIDFDKTFLSVLDSAFFSKIKPHRKLHGTRYEGLRFIDIVSHLHKGGYVFAILGNHLSETAIAGFIHNGYLCFVYGEFPFPLKKTGRVLKVSSNNPDYFFCEDGADINIPYSDNKLLPASSTLHINVQLTEAENAADTMCLTDEAPCSIIERCGVQQNSLCKCGQICVCGIFPAPVDAPTEEDYKRIQPYTAIIDEIEIDKRNLIVLDSLFFNHVLELKKSAVDKIDDMKYVFLESEESKDYYSIQCSLGNLFNESESVGFMYHGLLVIVHGKLPYANRLTGKKIKFDVLPPSTMIDEPLAYVEFLFNKKDKKFSIKK